MFSASALSEPVLHVCLFHGSVLAHGATHHGSSHVNASFSSWLLGPFQSTIIDSIFCQGVYVFECVSSIYCSYWSNTKYMNESEMKEVIVNVLLRRPGSVSVRGCVPCFRLCSIFISFRVAALFLPDILRHFCGTNGRFLGIR